MRNSAKGQICTKEYKCSSSIYKPFINKRAIYQLSGVILTADTISSFLYKYLLRYQQILNNKKLKVLDSNPKPSAFYDRSITTALPNCI
jgi:hypothetical protein